MSKFIKDPIYGVIEIQDEFMFIYDLLQAKEVKRLKNIIQLGECFNVFYNALHSRYTHVLGVYRNAKKIIENLNNKIAYEQQKIILSAALLHDVGHGPRSHCFEDWTNHNHEAMTMKIITSKESEVNQILLKNNIDPNEVMKIINHESKYKYFYQIVSSQIDADRLDYLLRDSYFTGASYGDIDIDVLLKWIQVENNEIVFNKKAIAIIEDILFSRAQMFKQIYINKKVLCYQCLVELMFKRYKQLYENKYPFKNQYNLYYLLQPYIKNEQWDLELFLVFDDNKLNLIIESWSKEDDIELKNLANNYLYHNNYYVSDLKQDHCLKEIECKFTLYNEKEPIIFNIDNKLISLQNIKNNPSFITNQNKFVFKFYLYKNND